jgi:hypothetical protein
LQPRGFQTLNKNLSEAFHELITHHGIAFALLAQAGTIEVDCPHVFHGTHVEFPQIWRKKPGPPDDLSGIHSLKDQRATLGRMKFDGRAAVSNREEVISLVSGLGEQLSGFELNVLPAAGDECPVGGAEVFEERVLGNKRVNVFLHRLTPGWHALLQ